jgi:hypothetical protein
MATEPAAADWREPFERALDEHHEDQRVRRDLADHLEERGDPDGEAVRWLARLKRHPVFVDNQRISAERLDTARPWYWFQWETPRPVLWWAGQLPRRVFDRLLRGHRPFVIPGLPGHCTYATRRDAEADCCQAYHAAKAAGWKPTRARGA